MAEMGREEGLPLVAMRCHTISEMRRGRAGRGGIRGCRELQQMVEIGRGKRL